MYDYVDYITLADMSIDNTQSDNVTLSGVVSKYNVVNSYGFSVAPGAFNPIPKNLGLYFEHKLNDPPIGTILLSDSAAGLMGVAIMPKSDALVRDRLIPQLKAGSIAGFSIGGNILEWGTGKQKRAIRAKLREVSLTSKPSDPDAKVESMQLRATRPSEITDKIAPRNTPWDKTAAVNRLRDFYEAETGSLIPAGYRHSFLWYDETMPQNLTSYKLPVADIVNNQPMIVPRAVFAAAASMRGARGGVDIPQKDRRGVEIAINSLYQKMNLDPIFPAMKLSVDMDNEEVILLHDLGLIDRDTMQAYMDDMQASPTITGDYINIVQ